MGMRQEIYTDGKLVEVIDTRDLAEEKQRLIADAEAKTQEAILERYPEHKQRNAALGLLSEPEKLQMNAFIQAHINAFKLYKASVSAAKTLNALDSV